MIRNKKGMTIPELLVAMFMSLIVVSATYSFYIYFINNASKERAKAEVQKKVNSVFSILSDDVRHSSFGLLKSSQKSVCLFVIDDNCSVGDDSFCKSGTDRFFVADGWQIIRDFADDNCPDGNIADNVYEAIVGKEYAAKINNYSPPDTIDVNILDIDSKCRSNASLCGDGKCDDIKDNKAIIVCGCKDSNGASGNYWQEGRRIGSIDTTSKTITFLSKEKALNYSYCSPDGRVLPANVWYIRKATDGVYWLYRNQRKVMDNVIDFQVEAGYDSNGDGMIDNTEYKNILPNNINISDLKFLKFTMEVQYKWKDKIYKNSFSTTVETFH